MPKTALIIRHDEFETLGGNFATVLEERGFEMRELNVSNRLRLSTIFDLRRRVT